MKRIAFFAHYDRDGIIDDYVIYYLRGLARVAERILFVSDCELRAGEAEKLEGLAELVSAARHGEYDFGSWKRGFAHLDYDLSRWDELIIANDSCYAPVFPFEDVFERMSKRSCDFWSPATNQIKGKFAHLSSYFLVFRDPILKDRDFLSFWKRVGPQPNASAVVAEYETGLSRLLTMRGYSYASLLSAEIGSFLKTKYIHESLHTCRLPWLKVSLLRDNPLRAVGVGRALDKTEQLYPRDLIDAHILRMTGDVRPAHYDYRFIGTYQEDFGPLTLSSKFKRNKKKPSGRGFWKVYIRLFRVPIFAFATPLRHQMPIARR